MHATRSVELLPDNPRTRLIAAMIDTAGRVLWPIAFKGFSRSAAAIGHLAHDRDRARIRLGAQSTYEISFNDPYWSKLLCGAYSYEPEIGSVLERLRELDDVIFLDCGANHGYWSVIASDPAFGWRGVFAIEASEVTFERLETNRKLNGGRFTTLNCAIHGKDGQSVRIEQTSSDHAGAQVAVDESGNIETITIASLLNRMGWKRKTPVVVKLDVEGAEFEAINGSGDLFDHDCVLFYEDHGRERENAASARLISDDRITVFHLDARKRLEEMKSVRQIDALKTNPKKGYNFFAATGSCRDYLIASFQQAGKGV